MSTFVLQYPRTRDCYSLFKGDSYTVAVNQAMATSGWVGGQGVKWVDSPRDEFLVTLSDGLYGGFMLNGSNEPSDQFTAMTGQQPLYGYGTFCAGGWLMATIAYEKYTWASRQVGPLIPITYTAGVRLRFSLRGYWTTEDEWTLSGDPRAPNNYYIGSIIQAPSADNNNYLSLQTSI
jgi:hypothetical protein